MYVNQLRVTEYKNEVVQSFCVSINGYWITIINQSGEVVYKRTPDSDNWLDETHATIGKAISALENALLDGVRKDI